MRFSLDVRVGRPSGRETLFSQSRDAVLPIERTASPVLENSIIFGLPVRGHFCLCSIVMLSALPQMRTRKDDLPSWPVELDRPSFRASSSGRSISAIPANRNMCVSTATRATD